MDQVVSGIQLEVNGKLITNFASVTEKGRTYRKPVQLMNKTVIKKVNPQYELTVEYMVPDGDPEIDWAELENGRLTILFDSGRRKTYPEVSCLSEGDVKYDQDGNPVKNIELLAAKPFEG